MKNIKRIRGTKKKGRMEMKVIGYGDNVVDRYLNQGKVFPGGNCINFSVYAKKIGMDSAYLGVFGDDNEAEHIRTALQELKIDISRCMIEEGSVTERCDVNIEGGDRVFVQYDERENLHGILELGDKEIEYLKEFDLIHLSCYAEEESEVHKLKDMPGLVSFDFSEEDEYRTDEYLAQICPFIDFALFSCEGMTEDRIKDLLGKVSKKGVSYGLATMGADGQILYDGNRFYRGKAEFIKAIDTMGAGDSFCTAFLMSFLKAGWKKDRRMEADTIREAFAYAAKFAALNCQVEGSFGYGAVI